MVCHSEYLYEPVQILPERGGVRCIVIEANAFHTATSIYDGQATIPEIPQTLGRHIVEFWGSIVANAVPQGIKVSFTLPKALFPMSVPFVVTKTVPIVGTRILDSQGPIVFAVFTFLLGFF